MALTWTNASVLRLAGDSDPVTAIIDRARQLVLDAQDRGWRGPPFDPLALAELLRIRVVPRDDVENARLSRGKPGGLQIEYNPSRPRGRVRFSIAHELAHSLFPDCAERVRNRLSTRAVGGDDWQLETLCNIAAAEILMPIGSLRDPRSGPVALPEVLALRERYDVSTEAILLRIIRLTPTPCAAFASSCRNEAMPNPRYGVDYLLPSRSYSPGVRPGALLPTDTVANQCTAIGYTANGLERWPGEDSDLQVECVGIPAFPGHTKPRVVGLATPARHAARTECAIGYVFGDATEPRGKGNRLIAHVTNDATPRWGGGFALVLRRKWPLVQQDFISWVDAEKKSLSLGNCRIADAARGVAVCSMVSQHGYGPSPTPRIRYHPLAKCLGTLASEALHRGATVHMPRIGCGQAGGKWEVVSELVDELLCSRGIQVTVYDLPGQSIGNQRSADLLP